MATDPVCGMKIDERKTAATAIYDGTTYYFCSGICKVKFEGSPSLYIDTRPGGRPRAMTAKGSKGCCG
jgi:YHS domain-containing protein